MLKAYNEMSKFSQIIANDEINRNGGEQHNYYEGDAQTWYNEHAETDDYITEADALSYAEADNALVCPTSNGNQLFYIQ